MERDVVVVVVIIIMIGSIVVIMVLAAVLRVIVIVLVCTLTGAFSAVMLFDWDVRNLTCDISAHANFAHSSQSTSG